MENSLSELTTITITAETRERLKILCKGNQTFDEIINKLILMSSEKLEI
ncbi:MAG: DUF7557 family protein [Nitrosopumilaceae archaeon]